MTKSVVRCLLFLTVFFLYACSDSLSSSSIKNLPVYPKSVEILENQTLLGWIVDVDIKHYESVDDYTNILKFYTERLPSYKLETLSEDLEEGRIAGLSKTENNIVTTVLVMDMKEENKVLISFTALPADN